jgi:hypothetical protein
MQEHIFDQVTVGPAMSIPAMTLDSENTGTGTPLAAFRLEGIDGCARDIIRMLRRDRPRCLDKDLRRRAEALALWMIANAHPLALAIEQIGHTGVANENVTRDTEVLALVRSALTADDSELKKLQRRFQLATIELFCIEYNVDFHVPAAHQNREFNALLDEISGALTEMEALYALPASKTIQ